MRRTATMTAWIAAALVAACGGSGSGDTAADDLPLAFPDATTDSGVPGDVGLDAGDRDATVAPDAANADPGGTGDDPGGTGDDPGLANDPGTDDPGAPDAGPEDPGPPPCQLTNEQCFGPTMENGKTYGNTAAYPFISSRQALYLRGQMWNPGNEDAGNDDDLSSSYCRDAGPDQFFRVYLMTGELLNIRLTGAEEIDLNLKVYRGIAGDEAAALQECKDDEFRYYDPRIGGGGYFDVELYPFTAPAEDWYTVVVDGTTSDDIGQYLLEMSLLNCAGPDCCCP